MQRALYRYRGESDWYLMDASVWIDDVEEIWGELGGRWFRLDENRLPTTQEMDPRRAAKLLLAARPEDTTRLRVLRVTWTQETQNELETIHDVGVEEELRESLKTKWLKLGGDE